MRRLNRKAFLGLSAGALALAAGVHVLHGLQFRRTADALYRQSGRAEEKGDRGRAVEYLERYLSLVPGDPGALRRYGDLLRPESPAAAPEQARRAASAYEKVLIHEPDAGDVRRRLADLLMNLPRPDDSAALTHLDVLSAAAPGDGELLSMRGRCHEALGHNREAIALYREAIRVAKDRVEVYPRLARLLRGQPRGAKAADRVMDAEAVVDGLIAANGGSARAYLARARYRRQYGEPGKPFGPPGADQDVARAAAIAPDDEEAIVAAAEVDATRGAEGLDAAIARLKRGAELHPKSAVMYHLLSGLELRAGRPAESLAALRGGVKALPDNKLMQLELLNALVSAGNGDEAAALIKRLRDTNLKPPLLDFQEARLLIARGRDTEAAAVLERVTSALQGETGLDFQTKQAYVLLGLCYQRLGKPDRQFAAFRRAVEITSAGPDLEVVARLGLAAAFEARDKIDEAADEYRKILTLPSPPSGVLLALARLFVVRDLRLPEGQRRWSDADRALDEAEKATPGSPEVAVLKAEVLMAKGQSDVASALLRAGREKAPDRSDFWVAQANVERLRGNTEESLRLVDEAERRLGSLVELRQTRAKCWGARGGPKAVEALTKIEESASDLKGDERRRLLGTLAEEYARAGARPEASRLTRRWVAEEPDSLPLRVALFDQAVFDGDDAAAAAALKDIERLDKEGSVGFYYGALLLIRRAAGEKEKGNPVPPLDQARRLLAEAAKLRPHWSRLPMTEAWADEVEDRRESALGNYLKAVDLGERSPSALMRTSQLLFDRGRFAQADQVLLKLVNRTDLTSEYRRLASGAAFETRDFERAVSQAHAAVAADPKDFRNPLWLGRVLGRRAAQARTVGRRAEADDLLLKAEQELRRAMAIAGDDPAPRVALVQLLASESSDMEAARAELREAERVFTSDRNRLALAQCYEAVHDVDKAAETYASALKAAAGDPATLLAVAEFDRRVGRYQDADGLLKTLGDMGAKAPREAAQARRLRAELLAASGKSRMANEVLRGVGAAEPAGAGRRPAESGTEDLRTRAHVLASQPSRARRREAVEILTGLVKAGTASANDRFLLAQLHEADGDRAKARELMQGLLAADDRNARYLITYAQSLLRHKQPSQAEPWVNRLVELYPAEPAAVALKAQLLHAQGQKAEAVAAVEAFVRDKDAQTLPFAQLLESLREFDAAEALYRKAAGAPQPGAAGFALIGFLGRRGRTSDALDLCDAAWKTSPPVEVSAASIKAVSASPSAGQEDYSRVADRIEKASEKQPDLIPLRFDLANLRTYQNRFDDALAIYRGILEQDKTNPAPLNNMAWLLAQQKGKEGEALGIIDRAIALQGESPALLDTRAVAYMALGRADDAVQDLENALTTSPGVETYFHLARAYRMAGKLDKASEALKKARQMGLTGVELHPLERSAYDRLAADLAVK